MLSSCHPLFFSAGVSAGSQVYSSHGVSWANRADPARGRGLSSPAQGRLYLLFPHWPGDLHPACRSAAHLQTHKYVQNCKRMNENSSHINVIPGIPEAVLANFKLFSRRKPSVAIPLGFPSAYLNACFVYLWPMKLLVVEMLRGHNATVVCFQLPEHGGYLWLTVWVLFLHTE